MKQLLNNKHIFYILMILFSSCSIYTSQTTDLAFKDIYPDVKMNTDLRLSYVKHHNLNTILLINVSKETVVFPENFNYKLYIIDKDEQKWIEIKNKETIHVPGGYYYLLPKKIDKSSFFLLSIFPVLDSNNNIEEIRAVVTGNIYNPDGSSGTKTGAYLDINVKYFK